MNKKGGLFGILTFVIIGVIVGIVLGFYFINNCSSSIICNPFILPPIVIGGFAIIGGIIGFIIGKFVPF